MDWLTRFGKALDYIENNLDEEIDYNELAKISASSTFHFQKVFNLLSNVPLGEYIRRRRLTLAAFDLQNGEKVIDVATKYGYASPTAFNRAFKAIHDISPSAAQKPDVVLAAYPRLSFQITIKGASKMDYKIAKKDAFRIVGVRTQIPDSPEESFITVPKFWQEHFQKMTPMQLIPLMDGSPKGLLGVSTCEKNKEGAVNYYYIAVASSKEPKEGMYSSEIPALEWAIFSGKGDTASLQDLQKRIFMEWLPTSGYEWANAPDIEVYLNDDPVDMIYEIWLPVSKVENPAK